METLPPCCGGYFAASQWGMATIGVISPPLGLAGVTPPPLAQYKGYFAALGLTNCFSPNYLSDGYVEAPSVPGNVSLQWCPLVSLGLLLVLYFCAVLYGPINGGMFSIVNPSHCPMSRS